MFRFLGHEFYPMSKQDYEGLAGADEGSYISWPNEDTTLVMSPDRRHLTIIETSEDGSVEHHWKHEVSI